MTDLVKPQGISVTYLEPDPAIVQPWLGTHTPANAVRWVDVPVETCDYRSGSYACYTTHIQQMVSASSGTGFTSSTSQPPPQTVINVYEDRAWNSYATTINPIEPGQYIEFKVLPSSYAVFVGIDTQGKTSLSPNSYRYGLMVDAAGVRVFENGAVGTYLGAKATNPILRIGRSTTGQVYYHYVGTPMVNSAQAPIGAAEIIHGFGLLYSSGDTIQEAKIATLSVAEPTVAIPMSLSLTAKPDPLVVMSSTMNLIAAVDEPACVIPMTMSLTATPSEDGLIRNTTVTIPGQLTLTAIPDEVGRGTWTLPAVMMHGADYDDPGFGTWRLPRLSATGYEGTYVPSAPDEGWWVLPRTFGWGLGLSDDVGSGDWELPAVAMIGAEEGVTYAQGTWVLPSPMRMRSVPSPWADDVLDTVSVVNQTSGLYLQRDVVLVVNSYGQLTSTLTLTRQQLLSLLDTLSATTSLTVVGTYLLSHIESLAGRSLQSMAGVTGADLPSDAAVWVVSLDGQMRPSVQYENYGFNSFFHQDGIYYGVAEDGIYDLSGADDNGAPIQAYVNLGRKNMGVQGAKHMPSIYVGASADGKLILRTDVDGVVRYYRARVSTTDMTQQRVDIGRGVRGTYWELEILNENGDDFDLADLTLLPVVLDRRI